MTSIEAFVEASFNALGSSNVMTVSPSCVTFVENFFLFVCKEDERHTEVRSRSPADKVSSFFTLPPFSPGPASVSPRTTLLSSFSSALTKPTSVHRWA